MRDYGCTVLLQHNEAKAFFEEARHPNLEALQRRERFFEEIQQTLHLRREGSDLITTIPDLDIAALMAPLTTYQTKNTLCYELNSAQKQDDDFWDTNFVSTSFWPQSNISAQAA